jgi:hypothetical protein
MAVLDKMKAMSATKSGIKTKAAVKLKFYANLENMPMPLGGMGVSGSCS